MDQTFFLQRTMRIQYDHINKLNEENMFVTKLTNYEVSFITNV